MVFWFGWQHLGPIKPAPGAERQQVAQLAAQSVVETLRAERGDIYQVALAHFDNDPTDVITQNLRAEIHRTGAFDLTDTGFVYKLRDLLNLRQVGHKTADVLLPSLERSGLAGIIVGQVYLFELQRDGVVARISFSLVGADGTVRSTGQFVWPATTDNDQKTNGSQNATAVPATTMPPISTSWFGRYVQPFLIWAIVILSLPVLTIRFLSQMTAKNSNRANVVGLATYALISLLIAWLFAPDWLSGPWLAFALLAAFVLSFLHTALIASRLVQYQKQEI